MKKNYQIPESEAMQLDIQSMIAASPGTPDATIDPYNEVNADEIESRQQGYGCWDDEDFKD